MAKMRNLVCFAQRAKIHREVYKVSFFMTVASLYHSVIVNIIQTLILILKMSLEYEICGDGRSPVSKHTHPFGRDRMFLGLKLNSKTQT